MSVEFKDTMKSSLYQQWKYWSDMLDKTLGQALPSIESDYSVFIGNPSYKNISDKPWADRAVDYLYLISVMNVGIPQLGYDFMNNPAGTGFIEPYILDGSDLSVTYWDTSDQYFTRAIENLYLAQFTYLGTLRLGYKSNFLIVEVGTQIFHFENAAVTRPLPSGLNSSSNGLTQYRFKVAYESAYVEYKNDLFDKNIAASAELLKF